MIFETDNFAHACAKKYKRTVYFLTGAKLQDR